MLKAKTYDWSQFTQKIEIEAPPARIFEAWTDDTIITRWFVTRAVIQPKKGGRLYLEWLGGDSQDTLILECRRPNWLVIPFGSAEEKVSVRIRKAGAGSVLELHQYGMKTTPGARVDWHLGCAQGWVFFLANLKAYLEHGIDLRSHDRRKSYKQGYINS